MLLDKKRKISRIFITVVLSVTYIFSLGTYLYKVFAEDSDALSFQEKLFFESTEVVEGKVISINNDWPKDTEYKYFELKIDYVQKTNMGIKENDTVRVRYPSGIPLITGNKPVLIRKDNEIKVYGKGRRFTEEPYVDLKYGGDSIIINKGEAPSELDYTLSLFGINSFSPSDTAINIAVIAGIVMGSFIILLILKRIFKIRR